ncbi:FMRFamide receptor-like [Elysia marginata]|uniref:FMRFamide receptor-like n=1 Tax=Elysia marginata TaxID=1093978 RepID=A0AAV4JPF3_9GAST|nr:FMRFamide receptor-like [Elysia marginata]
MVGVEAIVVEVVVEVEVVVVVVMVGVEVIVIEVVVITVGAEVIVVEVVVEVEVVVVIVMVGVEVKRIFTRKLIVYLILGGVVYALLSVAFYFVAEHVLLKAYDERLRAYFASANQLNITSIPQGNELMLLGSVRLALTYVPNYFLYGTIVLGTALLVVAFLRSIQMKNSLTENKDSPKMSAKEKRLVKSVIGICMIYIVTCTPRNVYQTIIAFGANNLNTAISKMITQRSVETLLSFNHAVNIFVYIVVNTNFRKQFAELFCFCCYDRGVN